MAGCVRKAWLVLGSLTLQLEDPTKGYFCSELDLGFPSVREVVSNRPDQDGIDDRTKYFGSRAVSANITALQGAGAQVDNIPALFAPFMAPAARPVLHYILDRPGAPERTMTLRGSGFSWPIAGPFERDLQLQWVCSDAYAHDGITYSATSSAGSSSPPGRAYNLIFNRIYPPGASAPSSGVIQIHGDATVWPVFRIYGPITYPQILCSVPGGGSTTRITFLQGFTIGSGQWVDVDTQAKTAVLNDGTSVQSQLNWGLTRFGPVPLKSYQNFTLTGNSTSGVTQAVATWQERWLT